jgi:multisubunit Na+/H+ antiporter MnhC subunit
MSRKIILYAVVVGIAAFSLMAIRIWRVRRTLAVS